ncbi:hypothetical protein HY357_04190 [Candidatus Roizmanbacteria bacterium]|nr:hypothetical protein [Candidatus Roizmanbacteria bacterium]
MSEKEPQYNPIDTFDPISHLGLIRDYLIDLAKPLQINLVAPQEFVSQDLITKFNQIIQNKASTQMSATVDEVVRYRPLDDDPRVFPYERGERITRPEYMAFEMKMKDPESIDKELGVLAEEVRVEQLTAYNSLLQGTDLTNQQFEAFCYLALRSFQIHLMDMGFTFPSIDHIGILPLGGRVNNFYKEKESNYLAYFDGYDPIVYLHQPEIQKQVDLLSTHSQFRNKSRKEIYLIVLMNLIAHEYTHMISVLNYKETAPKDEDKFDLPKVSAARVGYAFHKPHESNDVVGEKLTGGHFNEGATQLLVNDWFNLVAGFQMPTYRYETQVVNSIVHLISHQEHGIKNAFNTIAQGLFDRSYLLTVAKSLSGRENKDGKVKYKRPRFLRNIFYFMDLDNKISEKNQREVIYDSTNAYLTYAFSTGVTQRVTKILFPKLVKVAEDYVAGKPNAWITFFGFLSTLNKRKNGFINKNSQQPSVENKE